MKKIVFVLSVALLVIVSTQSCKKAAKALFPGADFDLPVVPLTLDTVIKIGTVSFHYPIDTPFTLPAITQYINMDSIIRANTANNFGAADISSIKLKQLEVSVASGYDALNNRLSNFNYGKFSLTNNPPQPGVLVDSLSLRPVGADSTISHIPVQTPELVDYVRNGNLNYIVTASIHQPPARKMVLNLKVTMTMK